MEVFNMKSVLYLFTIIVFIFSGCSKENPVAPEQMPETGSIVLKIDRQNAPASVAVVTAKLTRVNHQPIIAEMNLLSDSTADLNLTNIPVGEWHLKIDAKNQSGVVEYTGQTTVMIVQNTIIQVTLTLYPVTGGTGGIHIFVTWGTGEAVWKDFPANPVLKTSHNPANPMYVTMARIIYDDGKYKMWYNTLKPGAIAEVWYAESMDGKSWNTIGTQPVLGRGSYGSWDSYSVVVCHVMKEDNQYKMYYAGWNAHPNDVPQKVGYAVSSDGINWTKHQNPVMEDYGEYRHMSMTSVVKHNGIYYGYLAYMNQNSTYYIGLATSVNGINWEMSALNPILTSSYPWEGNGVTGPTAAYEDGKFKLFYSDYSRRAVGYAESADGTNFVKNTLPVFKREQTINNYYSISYFYYLNVNNQKRIYYTGQMSNLSNLDGIGFIYQ
jgi:predicted GH43/DUF377 family glycosyl hydrolase